jgi:hypothetical protein
MFQLYLITVLTTVLSGLALASAFLSERFERFADYSDFMGNTGYRVVLGAVSIFVGIANLFPTYEGDIPVAGDLLPSLAGMVTGVLLIAEYVNSRKTDDSTISGELAGKVERISAPYLSIIGVSSVIIGVLHAVMPRLPLL